MFVFGFKEFVAQETLIGFVHAMNGSHMCFKVRQLRKPGVRADGAAKWLFAGVFADV